MPVFEQVQEQVLPTIEERKCPNCNAPRDIDLDEMGSVCINCMYSPERGIVLGL